MPSEMKSLLTLLLPIIIILAIGTIGTLWKYGIKHFPKNLFATLLNDVDVVLYLASLYYIYLLFEHIRADDVMKIGLKIIVGGCWLAWVLSKMSCNRREEKQTQTISVIHKRKEYTEKEIHRIEDKFDSVEQRLEKINEETQTLSCSWCEYEFEIDRLKELEFTAENKAEIKRIVKLRDSVLSDIKYNRHEEEKLKTELSKLSEALSGYNSALCSIKEIANTIDGYIDD